MTNPKLFENVEQAWEAIAELQTPELPTGMEQRLFQKLELEQAWESLAELQSPELPTGMEQRLFQKLELEQAWESLAELQSPKLPTGMEQRLFQKLELEQAWESLAELQSPELPTGMEQRLLQKWNEVCSTKEQTLGQKSLSWLESFLVLPFRWSHLGVGFATCLAVFWFFPKRELHKEPIRLADQKKIEKTVVFAKLEVKEITKKLELYQNVEMFQRMEMLENMDAIQTIPHKDKRGT